MLVNVHDAKTRLSQRLQAVEQGQEVIIARRGEPVARLVPAQRPIRYGIAQSSLQLTPALDDPALDAEIEETFQNSCLEP